MANRYTAEDVLKLAVRVEGQAAAFYRRVAEAMPGQRSALSALADVEEKHGRCFESMCSALPEEERSKETLGVTRSFLEKAAEQRSGEGSWTHEPFTGQESLTVVLEHAIGLEKDAVSFYMGLKDNVSVEAGRARVDDVIQEEMGHIEILSRMLKAAGGR